MRRRFAITALACAAVGVAGACEDEASESVDPADGGFERRPIGGGDGQAPVAEGPACESSDGACILPGLEVCAGGWAPVGEDVAKCRYVGEVCCLPSPGSPAPVAPSKGAVFCAGDDLDASAVCADAGCPATSICSLACAGKNCMYQMPSCSRLWDYRSDGGIPEGVCIVTDCGSISCHGKCVAPGVCTPTGQ